MEEAELDQIHLMRYKKLLPLLTESKLWLDSEDQKIVESIINKYSDRLENFNKKNLAIVNPTTKELGTVRANLKRIIKGTYINPLYDKMDQTEWLELWRKTSAVCDTTQIKQEVIASRILLSRRLDGWIPRTDLEKALSSQIKLLMLKDFNEQNQEFINKNLI